ncbi:hypothetical protein BDW67DRAFT_163820 [Aspergillus spinulosporus]
MLKQESVPHLNRGRRKLVNHVSFRVCEGRKLANSQSLKTCRCPTSAWPSIIAAAPPTRREVTLSFATAWVIGANNSLQSSHRLLSGEARRFSVSASCCVLGSITWSQIEDPVSSG